MAIRTLLSAEDLFTIGTEDVRADLIRGELFEMSPAGDDHGAIGGRFAGYLGIFVLPRRLGNIYVAETGFVLRRAPDTVVAPDVAFVRAERLSPTRDRRGFLPLAPDLAVEVVSPTDRPRLITRKIESYREAGTPLLVVVYPVPRRVTVYRDGHEPLELAMDDAFAGDPVLPGFRLPVKDLFD